MTRNDAINRLNNSELNNKNFGTNEKPIDVIKEGAFWGTSCRDIYSGINGKWYRKSWKAFEELKNIDKKYYCSNYYDISINKFKVKCKTLLRFWENKSCINSIDPYGWFQWYFRYWLGRRSLDDKRQIPRWNKIISRLVKMIKDVDGRFDDYSISPKLRLMLLHWGYELVEDDLLWFILLFI